MSFALYHFLAEPYTMTAPAKAHPAQLWDDDYNPMGEPPIEMSIGSTGVYKSRKHKRGQPCSIVPKVECDMPAVEYEISPFLRELDRRKAAFDRILSSTRKAVSSTRKADR